MNIRSETLADVSAISGVTQRAFAGAAHTSDTEAQIVSALREAGALAVSLVAERDGVVLGHVAVSPVSLSDGTAGWYGLGPLSVEPAHQGQGIGSALMRAALDRLKAMGAAGCVVLGEPGYYGRFGFAAREGLVYPGAPGEYFMGLAWGRGWSRGAVGYHAGFGSGA